MTFSHWLRSLRSSRTTNRKSRRARQPLAGRKLFLEILEERMVLSPYLVTTTADSGPGSLRDAITQVNADTSHTLYASSSNSSVDEIDFNITAASDTGGGFNAGTGVATIAPQSALPIVTNAVLLNGYSQAGASPNTLSQGDNAVLKVQLNGVSAGASANGLNISAANVTVQGLDVVSFSGNGIALTGSGGDTIQGNYVGTHIPGLVSYYSFDSNANDQLGINNPSATNGISFVSGKSANGLTLGTGGYIEIPDSTTLDSQQITVTAWAEPNGPGPNNDSFGNVLFEKSVPLAIGGGNQVSISAWWSASDDRFRTAIGSDSNPLASSDTFAPGSFYSVAVTYDGITLSLYVNGIQEAQAVLNQSITYYSSIPWTIGSTDAETRAAGYPRTWNGVIDDVSIYNRALAATEIKAITNLNGVVELSNGGGIAAFSSNNTIGGTTAAARNIVSGNSGDGIFIGPNGNGGGSPSNNIVDGNYIGTDAGGKYALGNLNGVQIAGANSNVIGGTSAGSGNVISGSRNDGIAVGEFDQGGIIRGSSGNLVEGNYIGTDSTGTTTTGTDGKPLGNLLGVSVYNPAVTGNEIGGTSPGAGNLISGNGGSAAYPQYFALSPGVFVGLGSSGNLVDGNSIVGNLGPGLILDLSASNNTIGGTAAGAGNTISQNVGGGVYIGANGGNGYAVIPSSPPGGSGVNIDGTAGLYEGPSFGNTILGNVVAQNSGAGVTIVAASIATNNGAATPAGATANAIGGTAAGSGNVISGNTGDGVFVGNSATGVSILGNSISTNGDLGIHLDNPTGTNHNHAAPILTGLSGTAASPAISGSLTSVANTTFRIEFFANPLPSNLANTQGQALLGSVYVTTNASGKANFTASGLAAIPVSANYLTATATVATPSGNSYTYGDTSQFSSYQKVSYFFGGFQAPLSQAMNFALNRVIPIKFTLSDLTGAAVTSLAAVSSLQVAPVNSDGSLGTAFSPASTGNKGLTVNGSGYSFSWETKGLTAGSYAILLTLADGTVQTKVIQLTKNGGSSGLTTDAAGGTGTAPGGLLGGNIELYVDNTNGDLTADELARIQDAVTAADAVTEAYGVKVEEVTDPTLADVTLNMDTTSAVGGYADGVLGCTTDAGLITIINGWNFNAGSDATQIGGGQNDFETVVTHELGHALGLGHGTDSASVMYATLSTGTVNRCLAAADLNVADSDTSGACGLQAAIIPVPAVAVSLKLPTAGVQDRDAFFARLPNPFNSPAIAPNAWFQNPAHDAVFADPSGPVGTVLTPVNTAALTAMPRFGINGLPEKGKGPFAATSLFSDLLQEGPEALPAPPGPYAGEPDDSLSVILAIGAKGMEG